MSFRPYRRLPRLIYQDPALPLRWLRLKYLEWTGTTRHETKIGSSVVFEFDFSLDRNVSLMYLKRYERGLLQILRRELKTGSCFIDVGANIGYVSAYAASLVGPEGQVHSFEPVPVYFERLARLSARNPSYRIQVNNCALGDRNGSSSIAITSRPNIGWNTMVNGLMREDSVQETLTISVCRLDEYLFNNDISEISFVKIDVEGFEFPVLRGLAGFLDRVSGDRFPTLYIEIQPNAYPLLNTSLGDLDAFLRQYAYSVWSVEFPLRRIELTELTTMTNVICRRA